MLSHKCDRCGGYYDAYNKTYSETKTSGFMFLNIEEKGYYCTKKRDLCPDCNEELHDWFNKKKGE